MSATNPGRDHAATAASAMTDFEDDDDRARPTPPAAVRARSGAYRGRESAETLASARLPGLLREAGWIVFLALGVYLALVFVTHSADDAGYFFSGKGVAPVNKGGITGAWISDFLLGLFGLSAWWIVALMGFAVVRLFRRVESWGVFHRRSLAIALAGFVVLLICSSAIEALRMYSLKVTLPNGPGGVIGSLSSSAVSTALGFVGGTVLLLALFAAAFSVFSGLSWIRLAERVGGAVESVFGLARGRMEAKRDREAGAQAAIAREEKVEEMKRVIEDHPPIRIEPTVLEVPQSERVTREKQANLFADLPDSPLPPIALLDPPDNNIERPSVETLEFTSRLIERKLLDFNVSVKVVAANPGPVITRYEIDPAVGVKGSTIVNLARDLARALSVTSIRIVETIPGTSHMGLELPNPKREIVRLSEILGSTVYGDMSSRLANAMGKDIAGRPVVADIAKMPHVLIAGTTGSGKSVGINALILSLVYKATANEVRLILIDPKMLELSVYEGIPHLLAPVVTDMKNASYALSWCVAEMDRRYKLMSAVGVRNLAGYNTKIKEAKEKGKPLPHPFSLTPDNPEPLDPLPLIVVVIDELADMMMVVGKKVEELIARLAQKARASGIHLVLATQRPSVDVITGLIKANVPTRVAFQVSSKIDSRTILDQQGAEALLGQGDMLYLPPGSGMPQRVHGAFVSDAEVHRVVEFLKRQGEPQYIEGIFDPPEEALLEGGGAGAGNGGGGEADPLYDQAVTVVLQNKRASISLVQRHLRIGYNRAARLLEDMEKAGLVTSMQSNGNREIIAPNREN
jgi:DNA segregation ATPase FtsK/SpoIIIE, S-DNA-T family